MYSRTELLVGAEGLERLKGAHVLVVGLGGVGGYAAEQLCRAGIGELTLIDGDVIQPSNRNRQIIALTSTENKPKADTLAKRLQDINPNCKLNIISEYIRDERMVEILNSAAYDYVVDAIDTLSPKVFLIYHSIQMGLKIVSSMGSGGKMNPEKIQIADISKSHTCPLAYMVRKRLHRLGIRKGFKVVFSPEEIPSHAMREDISANKRTTIGTISYMPPLFGCFCASVVIRDILGERVVE